MKLQILEENIYVLEYGFCEFILYGSDNVQVMISFSRASNTQHWKCKRKL